MVDAVLIYQLARNFEWVTWLCPKHLKAWLARGWQVRGRKTPPHPLTCDDCTRPPSGGDATPGKGEP